MIVVFFAACVTVAQPEPSQFQIAPKKKEDRAVVGMADHKTIFAIHSKSGIGSANITSKSGVWPKTLVVLPRGGLPLGYDTWLPSGTYPLPEGSLRMEPCRVLRPLFDMIWNAAGWERSRNFDGAGIWIDNL